MFLAAYYLQLSFLRASLVSSAHLLDLHSSHLKSCRLHKSMASVFQPRLPVLDSKSESPTLFDGTTRLYINSISPNAQRVWIARNFKGLEDIELVPISLADKPLWYLEKVYPIGKVPSLEHDGKVIGESLDLLEYIDKNFAGPRIFPLDPAKEEASNELLKYTYELNKQAFTALRNKEATTAYLDESIGPVFDHLEAALGKFNNEGPYFLGQISVVDFAYIPFIERFDILFSELLNYNILERRPRLTKWFEAINQVEAYTSTKENPKVILEVLKKILGW